MDKTALAHEVENSLVLLNEELRSFVANLQAGTYRKATHNLYYAAFDAAVALLWSKGIHTETHDGAQSMLSLHFIKPGALPKETNTRLNELMSARHAADYKGAVEIGLEEITRHRTWVAGFVSDALALLKKSGMKVATSEVERSLKAAAAAELPMPPATAKPTRPAKRQPLRS